MLMKPWTSGAKAYHETDNLDTLASDWKRVRTMQHFIARPEALQRTRTICPCCKKVVKPSDTNRGHYYPKLKGYIVMHYNCAWGALLNQIFVLREIVR